VSIAENHKRALLDERVRCEAAGNKERLAAVEAELAALEGKPSRASRPRKENAAAKPAPENTAG
jgi:hypothetical protein